MRFVDVEDDFADELRRLVAGHAGDVDAMRHFRDSEWAPRPIDGVTDDGTVYEACYVRAPINNPHGPLDQLHPGR